MNHLLCKHSFDFQRLLLSSPPQVKCDHCGIKAFVDDAKAYDAVNKAAEIEYAKNQNERKEFWKASSLAFLSTGKTIGPATSHESACAVANSMLRKFDEKWSKS